MKTASIGIVAILMVNAFAVAASAALVPTTTLGQHDGPLQPIARSQDVLPLWGAPPGPYGPSNLTLQFKSPAFNGTPSFTRLANLDGDGDKDIVFATMNDSGYLNISAIDSTTHTMMWSNTSVNAGGFFFGAQVGDYRGIGRDDIFLTYMDGFCMLFGSNGTKAWSKAVSFASSQNFADINADGAPEFLYYDMMSSDRGIALNTTTGAKVWNSTTVGGMSFQVGNVDNDTQYEIIYVYDDWGNGKHNVMVYDAVSNKTEWQVNYTVMISPGVRDWDADGRHEIIVCDYLATPNRLTLLDINGSQVWTSNSYQARTWFNRMWNSDNDANLEIINSDPDTHDIEIIDGGTGVSQGYWTCTTYAPSDTWELPVDVDGTRYIASMGGSAGNFAVTVFWGSNLTMQHQYKFTEMTSMRIINDTDGNGFSEAIFTSWGGNVSVYNFTSHSLVWKRGGLGTLWGLNPAWILGDMAPSGKKLMDMATVTCPVTNVCNISFFNATDGIITNSTVQYQGGSLQTGDMDNDGGSEVVFTEVNYTGTNHTVIHILKAAVPPTLNDTIPTMTINEDSTNTHALDLESIFLFNKATTTMTYTIVPPTGTAYVTPTLDGKWVNIATAVQNWNGNTSINITASDGVHLDLKAQIPVKVLPVNDAPVITPVPAKFFTQDQLAQFDIVAMDPDGDLINFTDNTTLFEINATTGNVSFTPTNDDIGIYPVNVTVADKWGLNASVEFTVTIVNANDAPNITGHTPDPIINTYENHLYSIKFNGTDPDLKWGDTITWSVSLTPNGSKGDPTWLKMNATSGNLSGTSTYREIGGWNVTVNLTDSIGARATIKFSFEVLSEQNAPLFVDVPGDVTMMLGETFSFDVNATDADPEDTLEYSATTTPASDLAIDLATGMLTFTPTSTTDLLFEVLLEVMDGVGGQSICKFNITVTLPPLPPNHPPTATLLSPVDRSEIDALSQVLEWEATDEDGDPVTGDIYFGMDRVAVSDRDTSVLVAEGVLPTELTMMTGLEWGGTYYWTVIPFDGRDFGDCTSGVWSFTNRPEVIPPQNKFPNIPVPDKQYATVGVPFSLALNGTDPDPWDKVNLTWELEQAPPGMSMDPSTGKISWTPTEAQLGNHTIMVSLTDGKDIVRALFQIEVQTGGGGDDGDGKTTTSSMLPFLLLLVLLVVVALVVAMMMMRRKKGQAPAPAPPQPQQPQPQPQPQPAPEPTLPQPEPQPLPMDQQQYPEQPPQDQQYYQQPEQQYPEPQQPVEQYQQPYEQAPQEAVPQEPQYYQESPPPTQ